MSRIQLGRGRGGDFPTVTASTAEVSRRTGLSESTILRLVAAGRLRAVKSGARTLIFWETVEAYLASLPSIRGGA